MFVYFKSSTMKVKVSYNLNTKYNLVSVTLGSTKRVLLV